MRFPSNSASFHPNWVNFEEVRRVRRCWQWYRLLDLAKKLSSKTNSNEALLLNWISEQLTRKTQKKTARTKKKNRKKQILSHKSNNTNDSSWWILKYVWKTWQKWGKIATQCWIRNLIHFIHSHFCQIFQTCFNIYIFIIHHLYHWIGLFILIFKVYFFIFSSILS